MGGGWAGGVVGPGVGGSGGAGSGGSGSGWVGGSGSGWVGGSSATALEGAWFRICVLLQSSVHAAARRGHHAVAAGRADCIARAMGGLRPI